MTRYVAKYGKGRVAKAVLVLHGEDDQICPFPTTGACSAKLLKQGKPISYPGLPHGMPTTHADIINRDLLAFIRSCPPSSLHREDPGRCASRGRFLG